MEPLISWDTAEVRSLGDGFGHELQVKHLVAGKRAASHLEAALYEWSRANRFDVTISVGSAEEYGSTLHAGTITVEGADLLAIPPSLLREAFSKAARPALERGEREDSEDLRRMDTWLSTLQDDTFL